VSALKVTQVKSKNGANHAQRETLRTLGLRKIGHTVEINDTPQARGLVHRVRHLVKVDDES
jgi:large subunit ribosomal protein L30